MKTKDERMARLARMSRAAIEQENLQLEDLVTELQAYGTKQIDELRQLTIRRCIGFAKRDGFGGLFMLNLFAFRSTDPRGLLGIDDPVGPRNDELISDVCLEHRHVVAAWGSHKLLGALLSDRARHVEEQISREGIELQCFGTNADCQPKHPLYLKSSTEIVPLRNARAAQKATP